MECSEPARSAGAARDAGADDPQPVDLSGPTRRVPLHALCVGRSGDKGDVANIGIVARDARHFALLAALLPAEEVERRMSHLVRGRVARYALPGVGAFNYVCTQALGGGGAASLRVDRQGKTYAQQLLCQSVDVPERYLQGVALPKL